MSISCYITYMKVCIYGAGAIGGFLGARLAAQGHAVSAVARGATLAALRSHGMRLRTSGAEIAPPVDRVGRSRARSVRRTSSSWR